MYWVTSIYFVGKVVKCRMHNKTGFTGNIQFHLKIKARLKWLSVFSTLSKKRDAARPENLSGQVVMRRIAFYSAKIWVAYAVRPPSDSATPEFIKLFYTFFI